jgi:hypothetical protein
MFLFSTFEAKESRYSFHAARERHRTSRIQVEIFRKGRFSVVAMKIPSRGKASIRHLPHSGIKCTRSVPPTEDIFVTSSNTRVCLTFHCHTGKQPASQSGYYM